MSESATQGACATLALKLHRADDAVLAAALAPEPPRTAVV